MGKLRMGNTLNEKLENIYLIAPVTTTYSAIHMYILNNSNVHHGILFILDVCLLEWMLEMTTTCRITLW